MVLESGFGGDVSVRWCLDEVVLNVVLCGCGNEGRSSDEGGWIDRI